MSDYPKGDGVGRIVTLTDADGDGTIDTRTIFAAGLPFPNGLLAWNGGLLVTAAPDILHLADRDGDGVAETSEVVLTGFQAGNQQLRVNGHCSGCHRSGGIGTRVGPDLAGMRSKTREQLLEDILDPNRRLTGEYAAVAVVTKDGAAFTGLVSGETPSAVNPTLAEGKVETIPRGSIEVLRGTGRSLMPEGFEQSLNPRDFADLTEFLLRGR